MLPQQFLIWLGNGNRPKKQTFPMTSVWLAGVFKIFICLKHATYASVRTTLGSTTVTTDTFPGSDAIFLLKSLDCSYRLSLSDVFQT